MPWARFDTGFLRDHFADIPDRQRCAAIALYQGLVLLSAELLLDGAISRSVFDAVATESGISERQGTGRLRSTIGVLLVRQNLLARTSNGGFQILHWREHHSSREDVQRERKLAAERQRRARDERQGDQLSLPSRPESRRDVTVDVTAMSQRDLARAGTEAAAEQEKSTSGSPLEDQPVDNPPAGWPNDPLLDPAAAAADAGPTEPQLTKLLTAFPDADRSSLTVIQPLAQALPAQTVLELAWQLRGRKKPGGIGLLVDRLRDTIRERIATAAVENGQPAFDTTSRIERLKRDDPRSYITAMATTLEPDQIAAYLDRHVPDEDDRLELADLAADLRRDAAAA